MTQQTVTMTKPNVEPIQDRYIVPGLKRGLDLLQMCARQPAGLVLSDAAQTLGISRSSTFRLLYTLEKLGFVQRGADERKFFVGLQVVNLRAKAVRTDVGETAREPMERLRAVTGMSVHLALRDSREVVYIHSLSGQGRVTTNIGVGTRLPAHATSMGRLLLSALSDRELRALYRNVRLEAYTNQTTTAMTKLVEQVRADADRGYVASEGFFDSAIWSVAAPIRNQSGSVCAAISVTCPANSVEKSQLRGPMKDRVCATAEAISAFMGYQQPDASK